MWHPFGSAAISSAAAIYFKFKGGSKLRPPFLIRRAVNARQFGSSSIYSSSKIWSATRALLLTALYQLGSILSYISLLALFVGQIVPCSYSRITIGGQVSELNFTPRLVIVKLFSRLFFFHGVAFVYFKSLSWPVWIFIRLNILTLSLTFEFEPFSQYYFISAWLINSASPVWSERPPREILLSYMAGAWLLKLALAPRKIFYCILKQSVSK